MMQMLEIVQNSILKIVSAYTAAVENSSSFDQPKHQKLMWKLNCVTGQINYDTL